MYKPCKCISESLANWKCGKQPCFGKISRAAGVLTKLPLHSETYVTMKVPEKKQEMTKYWICTWKFVANVFRKDCYRGLWLHQWKAENRWVVPNYFLSQCILKVNKGYHFHTWRKLCFSRSPGQKFPQSRKLSTISAQVSADLALRVPHIGIDTNW